ncbi:DNA/RNA helicase [Streptococcus chenjunshii]|uniref:DNA/RNA helicase n=1 Tax=Streptococcus chenjunshii TaxID=2173853 RepID=A0A372KJK8_9STRE|nr:DEAD/DEAH box helicase [Streptococcus chenjunshii]AXQ79217.1 DNA/RNA helicase [Streptococcus chenjunshii]RFU50253.1 DNA/RNA helicase [Streptococcus chenjunshii]RFU52465.1 DNA/RNA helicase [Streptococcus chenjunshii]
MDCLDDYFGRLFTEIQLPAEIRKQAQTCPAAIKKGNSWFCVRCSSLISRENALPNGEYYCRNCLVFGRISTKASLYFFRQQKFPAVRSLIWTGKLTTYQKRVSDALVSNLEKGDHLLVHAVTGAGKTEMIYKMVASVIDQGKAVCIASPRVDVCIELYKRLTSAFSCPITLLHGNSDPYKRAPLLIATTHQLLKFYRAFDLLIIDEVDAFPFTDNNMLYHGTEKSLKKDGIKIFLTATSTERLDRQVKKGQLKKLHLARRFHGKPLVIPKTQWLGNLLTEMDRGRLPRKLLTMIEKQRKTGFPLLLFFPNIEKGERLAVILQRYFTADSIACVSSQSENRLELIEQFRKGNLQILVSTTILERGVTFPNLDVFILLAHHHLYTKSSLIQMAGRVGRSSDRPTGELIFFHNGLTKSIKKAISEIKEMNQKGGF